MINTYFDNSVYANMRAQMKSGSFQEARVSAQIILASGSTDSRLLSATHYQLSKIFAKEQNWTSAQNSLQEAKKLHASDLTWVTRLNTQAAVYTFKANPNADKEARHALRAIEAVQLQHKDVSRKTLNAQEKEELTLVITKTESARAMAYLAQKDFDNAKSYAISALFNVRELFGEDHPKVAKANYLVGVVFASSAKDGNKEDKAYAEDKLNEALRIYALNQLHLAKNPNVEKVEELLATLQKI